MNYSLIAFKESPSVSAVTQKMAALGVTSDFITVIRENKDLFASAFSLAGKSDVTIILCGGDETSVFTKKQLSAIMDKPLTVNERACEVLDRYFRYNPLKIVSDKEKEKITSFPQGFVCEGGEGKLAGAYFSGKKSVVLLPDEEAEILFGKCVLPVVSVKKNIGRQVFNFKIYGADEIEREAKLSRLKKDKRYTLSVKSDETSDCLLTFVFQKDCEQDFIDETLRDFVTLMDKHIYADEDVSLADKAVDYLTVRKATVGTAESFTGGMIASRLVDVAGVSSVFGEGLVTYSNESKVRRLGVSKETLKQYGAVSNETAYEMTLGLLSLGNSYAVATTGIAGPGGGSPEKPVGLCYYAVGSNEGVHVYRKFYQGTRNEIRKQAVNDALFALIGIMK